MYLATSPRYDIVTWNGVVLECGTLYVVKHVVLVVKSLISSGKMQKLNTYIDKEN